MVKSVARRSPKPGSSTSVVAPVADLVPPSKAASPQAAGQPVGIGDGSDANGASPTRPVRGAKSGGSAQAHAPAVAADGGAEPSKTGAADPPAMPQEKAAAPRRGSASRKVAKPAPAAAAPPPSSTRAAGPKAKAATDPVQGKAAARHVAPAPAIRSAGKRETRRSATAPGQPPIEAPVVSERETARRDAAANPQSAQQARISGEPQSAPDPSRNAEHPAARASKAGIAPETVSDVRARQAAPAKKRGGKRADRAAAAADPAPAAPSLAVTDPVDAPRPAAAGTSKVVRGGRSIADKPIPAKAETIKTGVAKTGLAKTGVAKAAGAKSSIGGTGGCAPIKLGFLSDFVGFHLRLAQDASYRAFARFKEKDLVKPGRFPALAIIHLNPGISQSALGRAIARDKSTVSPLIKDLQKNGLINRKPSPNDRRSVTLVLTKKGERVLDRLHVRAREHEHDLDKLVGASKARLVGLLDKITAALTA